MTKAFAKTGQPYATVVLCVTHFAFMVFSRHPYPRAFIDAKLDSSK